MLLRKLDYKQQVKTATEYHKARLAFVTGEFKKLLPFYTELPKDFIETYMAICDNISEDHCRELNRIDKEYMDALEYNSLVKLWLSCVVFVFIVTIVMVIKS